MACCVRNHCLGHWIPLDLSDVIDTLGNYHYVAVDRFFLVYVPAEDRFVVR